jgi:hypothetical protein
MTLSLDYLRSQIFSRFVQLALDNSNGKSTEELRQEASRQIVRETREDRRAVVLAASPFENSDVDTPDGALDTIVMRIWKICETQHVSKRLMRAAKKHNRKKQVSPPIAPNIMPDNPVMVDDAPITAIQGPTAPLIRSSGYSSPVLIEDSEYLRGLHCREAQNLRASIDQNELIRKHREAQSAAHRNRMKYMG